MASACESWEGIDIDGEEYEIVFDSLDAALKWVAERHGVTIKEAFGLISDDVDGEWKMPGAGRIGLIKKQN